MKNPILFRYPGSKWNEMKAIIKANIIPPHIHWCDPFGGSGTSILAKEPSKVETFNDLDKNIYNVFKVCREYPEELKRLCYFTIHMDRETFNDCQEILFDPNSDPVKKAWAYCYCQHGGYNGTLRLDNHKNFVLDITASRRNAWQFIGDSIDFVVQRFKKTQLENMDYWTVMQKTDSPDTLFFIDPPYMPDTRNHHKYYCHEFSGENHREMLNRIKTIKGKIMLCGYECPEYAELGWKKWTYQNRVTFGGRNHPQKITTECVWISG